VPTSGGKIARVSDSFMADLAAQEEYAANQMAWEYADRIQRLEGSLRAVENDMLSRSLRGESIPVSWLHRQDSYNRLIVQAADEFDKYGKIAGSFISQAQKDAVYRAANLAKEQVKAAVPLATGLNSFQKLPAKSLERLVGNLQADSPLAERLADFGDWASGTISEEMKHSLAAGINPRQTMKNVTDKLGYAPTRAATMLRTEQYRAFRQSLLDNYRNNPNLVKAWIWNAHTGDRTCPICWAMHGTEWPLDDVMATHPNCRCNMIPKTPSWAELGYADIPETGPDVTPGPELFKQLGEAAQRRILGPRRFDLYKAGKIDLPDMVRNTYTRDWGDGKALFDIPTTLRNAEQRLEEEARKAADLISGELLSKPKRGRPKGSKNKPKLSSREKELGLNPLPEDAPEWAKKVREMQISPTLNPSDEETLRAAGSLLREQFEERQARAGLEMAREKVRLKAREKELYSEYQKIDDELYARRAKLTNDMTDPDYLTLPQFYELPENATLFKRLTEIDAELQETTRKLANFDDEILAAERKARVDILNTVRPMGGKKKLSWYKPGRGRGWREGESYVAENAEYMPRSWWDKAASGRPMRVIEVRRGYYDGNSQSAVTIALSGGDPNHIKSTAIHEIGHWMENNIPGITEAEKAFYERRTLGEALAHMGPGYRENEVTRRDQFINPYMGKDYGGSYYELLTMGVQSTFRHSILDDDILSDKDYADFILGLLALVP
jgi:SPP1 gp7 family putative phage head morphogenesis protein